MKAIIAAFFTLLVASLTAAAIEPADSLARPGAPTLADAINAAGFSKIQQPTKLNARIAPVAAPAAEADEDESATGVQGYRIQVYSGNNARRSKGVANDRAAQIGTEYAELAVYVSFEAPYWRVKVGDFPSYEDAQAALSLLKNDFPAFAKEMRVVRDRIKR